MKEDKPTRHQYLQQVYQVHDVAILSNNGKSVTASVAFSANDGPLRSSMVNYDHIDGMHCIKFAEVHLHEVEGLVDEVVSELAEAAAYQRDLNKEKN